MRKEKTGSLIKTNYRFLKKLYIKDIKNADFGFYAWSEADYGETNNLWNHAVILKENKKIPEKLTQIEKFYDKKERSPSVYIPKVGKNREPGIEGYENSFTDVWMFYTGEEIETRDDISLEKVKTQEQMGKYVELFYKCRASDLNGPYAGLSREYGKQLKERFDKKDTSTDHFILYLEETAVGHITTVKDGEKAAIYNLGTIPDQRGKGIASTSLAKAINQLKNKGIETIFLQTEKDSENEKFFNNRGFKTEFEGLCYSKIN